MAASPCTTRTRARRTSKAISPRCSGSAADDVRVLNPFVGGAFGSGLRPQYQVYLAVLAAKKLERSVRVSMTRQQMFTHVHRPECLQSVSLPRTRKASSNR